MSFRLFKISCGVFAPSLPSVSAPGLRNMRDGSVAPWRAARTAFPRGQDREQKRDFTFPCHHAYHSLLKRRLLGRFGLGLGSGDRQGGGERARSCWLVYCYCVSARSECPSYCMDAISSAQTKTTRNKNYALNLNGVTSTSDKDSVDGSGTSNAPSSRPALGTRDCAQTSGDFTLQASLHESDVFAWRRVMPQQPFSSPSQGGGPLPNSSPSSPCHELSGDHEQQDGRPEHPSSSQLHHYHHAMRTHLSQQDSQGRHLHQKRIQAPEQRPQHQHDHGNASGQHSIYHQQLPLQMQQDDLQSSQLQLQQQHHADQSKLQSHPHDQRHLQQLNHHHHGDPLRQFPLIYHSQQQQQRHQQQSQHQQPQQQQQQQQQQQRPPPLPPPSPAQQLQERHSEDVEGANYRPNHCIEHVVDKVWRSEGVKINDIEPSRTDFKLQELPLARVKKVMKQDDEIEGISRFLVSMEALIIMAKACELFVNELTLRGWHMTEENRRRTLQRMHLAQAMIKCEMFDFLIDIVPRDQAVPAVRRGKANWADAATEAEEAVSGPVGVVQSGNGQREAVREVAKHSDVQTGDATALSDKSVRDPARVAVERDAAVAEEKREDPLVVALLHTAGRSEVASQSITRASGGTDGPSLTT